MKNDMSRDHRIKLIKRVERERAEQQAEGSSNQELSAHSKTRVMVATLKEWVSEFQQARDVRYQETKQQLGWSENEVNSHSD